MRFKLTGALSLLLAASCLVQAQSNPKAQPEGQKRVAGDSVKPKPSKDPKAEQILEERRASARSMLITLASDTVKFSDAIARARTLARVADLLWDSDKDRARALFRSAWEATDAAEKVEDERYAEFWRQSESRISGFTAIAPRPQVRREVLRLAAKRDRSLAEEFLRQQQKDRVEAKRSRPGPLGGADASARQRLDVARQLLDADLTEQALQFADPALSIIDQTTVDFLSTLREKNAAVADERYARMLSLAVADPQSDANTVSVLSSYLFTPHSYFAFSAEGTFTNNYPGNRTPPQVTPALQLAFFRTAANILLRPLAPPGQEQNSAGHDGHYLVIKRLMPLFEQRAPAELTAALRGQLEVLTPLTTKATRDRDDDDWVRTGVRPDKMQENWEQSLLDQLDHARTSAERDQINFRLALHYAGSSDLSARERVEKIDQMEFRNAARSFIDTELARRAVSARDPARILELCRTGQFGHLPKVYFLTQAAKLLALSENEKGLTLIDSAATEARRIGGLDPDSPRAFFAVANAMLVVNRAAVWEAMSDAIKASNSADGFGGEDGQINFYLTTKAMSFSSTEIVPDFDVDKIFGKLTVIDYDRSVELAQGLSREPARALATIAIARVVLSETRK